MDRTKQSTKRLGLSEKEVLQSRKEYGDNRLTKQKSKPFLLQFFANLNDPVIRILLCAMAVNLLLLFGSADWMETVGIGVAVLLATLVSTLSEYSSAKAFDRLSEESSKVLCRVVRGGVLREISIGEIVVGDLIKLSPGDAIPADGVMMEGILRVDQSSMTGETKEVEKCPGSEVPSLPSSPTALFRGSNILSGEGLMEVRAVGDKTFLGGISREIQSTTRESPLKRRLAKLARQISRVGYLASALVALAYLFHVFVLQSGKDPAVIFLKLTDLPYLMTQLLHAFTLALTVLVVAVPEGLPMMVAVVLSSNVKRMIRDRVLVRKPVGIEAAGSMNLLFTDKTGTLTEGKMKLTKFCFPDGSVESSGVCDPNANACQRLFALAFAYGTQASFGKDRQGNEEILGGSGTERALLESLDKSKLPNARVLSRLPFDSVRKYAAVTLLSPGKVTLLLGAPERLFPFIGSRLLPNGTLASGELQKVKKVLAEWTDEGCRVLALATSTDGIDAERHAATPIGKLTLVGLIALRDDLRSDAKQSVKELQEAGIHVVMITGDSPKTARSIAASCGILDGKHQTIVSGEELSRLSDPEVKDLLPSLAVVARALPGDKSRLVRLAEESGDVVGMTGDGINDAPALRLADVGFAMGSGTQVAKDAGDIIILDNKLSSLAKAVLYGRTIFKSIRKFITLQLTMNFCAVAITMICPFLGVKTPITVVQMLWINLIMDTLGGLAFAGEAPLADYMKEPPKARDEPILNRYMINEILVLGSFTVGLLLYFLKSPTLISHFRSAQDRIYLLTAFFVLFIFASVFNCFNARTDRLKLSAGLWKNHAFVVIMSAILAIQVGFVYLGGSLLRTAPLTVRELLLTLALSFSVFPAELARKALWRLRGKRGGY